MKTVKEPNRRGHYRIQVGKEGANIEFAQDFWDNAVVRLDGTTNLDLNIATILDELEVALYYVTSLSLIRH